MVRRTAAHQFCLDVDASEMRLLVAWCRPVCRAQHIYFQRFFDPLTVYHKETPYVAGEFGAALGVISILMAV